MTALRSKEYARPMPATWWLRKRSSALYMLRELTSVFVGAYAIFLLVLVWRAADSGSFAGFYDALQSPLSVALHVVVLAMVTYHTITWLILTARAVVIWRGEQRLGPIWVAAPYLIVWAIISGVVAGIALG